MEKTEEQDVNFTHDELMEVTTTALNELLQQDAFLSDLPKHVTLEEVNNEIALQYGRSITIYVRRGDGDTMPVIVPQIGATVADLKKAIKRFITLRLEREKSKRNHRLKMISWKYIWKTYCLQHDSVLMNDNNIKLKDLGIENKSSVTFVKKRKNMRF